MIEKFLLHTCCAPCGIAVIDELRYKYNLTVFFFNPNIFPEAEYLRRKREVVRVCEEWGVPMIDADYAPEEWEKAVRGFESEPEGGTRCGICFRVRLFRTAQTAAERKFDVFGTTLTAGRNKKSIVITPIGEAAGKRFGVRYHAEDWKKGGREERGRTMIRERGIYRQNYCGCRHSMRPGA